MHTGRMGGEDAQGSRNVSASVGAVHAINLFIGVICVYKYLCILDDATDRHSIMERLVVELIYLH